VYEPRLVSNGYTLASEARRLGWLTPTDPAQSRAALWEQYRAQGYLWLKGILDRDEVLDFRRRYLSAFIEAGVLSLMPGTPLVEGIVDTEATLKGSLKGKTLMEVVRWAEYEAFCLATPIRRFYEMFFEGPPYLHKRKLLRSTLPGEPRCTGAHYDLIYLRGGTDRICTSWIPIGDTPVEMGGLIYLEGSHTWGRQMEAEFGARHADLPPAERINAYNRNMDTGWLTQDLPALADRLDTRWLIADYETGDMVVHSSYMIHAATTNRDAHGRIRLSTDIRYQRVRDEIDVRWNNHWSLDDML